MEINILNLIDRIRAHWETKIGLFLCYSLFLLFYFWLLNHLKIEEFKLTIMQSHVLLPFLLGLLLSFFWVYKTNRFFIRFKDKITAGIIVIGDEEMSRMIVNKIVRKVIEEINNSNNLNNINIKLLPTNFCVHTNQVRKYHNNFNFMYDIIIRIFVESGHYESIDKIIIPKLSVTFMTKSSSLSKKVIYNTIDLIKDMDLQVQSRNWEYLKMNDGIDKKKYLSRTSRNQEGKSVNLRGWKQ